MSRKHIRPTGPPSKQSRFRSKLQLQRLEDRLAPAFVEFVDPNPNPGNQFGATVLPLSTGNVVVTSPYDDFGGTDAGAVYLFNGATHALIATLRGSSAGNELGFGGVTALSNGNYVVASPRWDNGTATDAGAVSWGNGTTGVAGVVSAANSLVGSVADDKIGDDGVTALTSGNYVVVSPYWHNWTGAVTWGNGSTGTNGVISAANSLVGSSSFDQIGSYGVIPLKNGNYVVRSPRWRNGAASGAGAVTWGSGTSGVSGVVSAANSLVGSAGNDSIGNQDMLRGSGVTALTNGNYVVVSPRWDNGAATDAGAVTWGNGASGTTGVVSAVNSLVGSTTNDRIGYTSVTALTNGNYVVASSNWTNGTQANAGAATWGNGTTGTTGVVSAANSLVGSQSGTGVGLGHVIALTNGNYVVPSSGWANGAANVAGAVTWGNGSTGTTGVVSAANSLVGSNSFDMVGNGEVVALTNGNYVVRSPYWNNGAATEAGAITWGNGVSGTTGVVSAANSLVGSTTKDHIGSNGVTSLTNGNYVVATSSWDNGTATDAGAVTWGNGTSGTTGVVSTANSLVGSTTNDNIGSNRVTRLTNGNYVVASGNWSNGIVASVGAATWGNGSTGTIGVVSTSNSLVGSTTGDDGRGLIVTPLTNGNYVVAMPAWDSGAVADAGAVTWGNGTTGTAGVISAANSLVGSSTNDGIGYDGIKALSNGNYVVRSFGWDNGAQTDAGAVTWGNGTSGISGVITSTNSAVGEAASAWLLPVAVDDVNGFFYGRFLLEGSGRVRGGSLSIGFADPPTVTSVVFGDGTAQRSLVKRIVVNFSEPVSFMGSVTSAFTLSRTGPGGTVGDVTLSASPTSGPASSVTITFSGSITEFGSLMDGVYDFMISAAQVSGVGGALDGNSDGVAGGSYVVVGSSSNSFYRLFGDSNGDRIVNFTDFIAFRNTPMLLPSSIFDFEDKGYLYVTDFEHFRKRFNLMV